MKASFGAPFRSALRGDYPPPPGSIAPRPHFEECGSASTPDVKVVTQTGGPLFLSSFALGAKNITVAGPRALGVALEDGIRGPRLAPGRRAAHDAARPVCALGVPLQRDARGGFQRRGPRHESETCPRSARRAPRPECGARHAAELGGRAFLRNEALQVMRVEKGLTFTSVPDTGRHPAPRRCGALRRGIEAKGGAGAGRLRRTSLRSCGRPPATRQRLPAVGISGLAAR